VQQLGAHIEAGKLHLEKQPREPGELIAGALAQLGPESSKRVSVTMPEGLPHVDRDPEFAGQVVKQLVENALKYSPAGSPIAVTAVPKGGKIVIGVADRGPGIAERERAFSRSSSPAGSTASRRRERAWASRSPKEL